MSMFYVYTHSNDNGIFYIGKGKGRRAWSKDRGKKWIEKAKSGYTIDVPYNELTNKEALDLEAILIHNHGMQNLVNVIKPSIKENRGTVYYDIIKKAKDIKFLMDIHDNIDYYYKIPFYREHIELIQFVYKQQQELRLL